MTGTELAPIGLDELVQRAQLMARLDRKYVLPAAELPTLTAGLAADVRVLDIDGRREFSYRSVYFDTPELDSYLAAAHRRRRRFKLRIRSYLDSDLHFLEVKTRGQRGTTVKERVPWTGEPLDPGSAARAHVDETLAEAGIPSRHLRFQPVLTTHYRRTTLFVPTTGSRVTIDTGLSWSLPGSAEGRSRRSSHRRLRPLNLFHFQGVTACTGKCARRVTQLLGHPPRTRCTEPRDQPAVQASVGAVVGAVPVPTNPRVVTLPGASCWL